MRIFQSGIAMVFQYLGLLLILFALFFCPSATVKPSGEIGRTLQPDQVLISQRPDDCKEARVVDSKPMYGVTIESIEPTGEIIDSLKEVSAIKRLTTRIVFQSEKKPANYLNAVRRIKESNITDLMGLIVDSSAMHKYKSVPDYEKRVLNYLNELGDPIDIWEVGNEVNGEWVGWKEKEWERKTAGERAQKRKLVAAQILSAFKLAKSQGRKTALTLYYNDDQAGHHCWPDGISDGKEYEMFSWVNTYLTPEIRDCLDYVFISFYEDDCPILSDDPTSDTAKWVEVFTKLSSTFSKAKLGFGEFGPQCICGECNYQDEEKKNRLCVQCLADQKSYIPRYYRIYDEGIKSRVPRYIGGYFYWYFSQDMVPKNKPALEVLKQAIAR